LQGGDYKSRKDDEFQGGDSPALPRPEKVPLPLGYKTNKGGERAGSGETSSFFA
jgi:hypothetical protein